MKTFCITGSLSSDLEMVLEILTHAGVKRPKSPPQDQALSLSAWHERLLAESNGEQVIQQPGKLWEHLASNIFLSNMDSPLWAWAESQSVWALDFWQKFDPKLHFLLVYTSPQRMISAALASGMEQEIDIAALLRKWHAYNSEMLHFHNRNADKTILIGADQCAANPEAFINACSTRWKLELAQPPNLNAAINTLFGVDAAPLSTYLAEQLRQSQPQIQLLQNELEATLSPLLPSATTRQPLLENVIRDYRALLKQANQTPELVKKLDSAIAQQHAMHNQIQFLTEQNKQQEILHAEKDAQREKALQAEIATQHELTAQAIKHAKHEQEILLLHFQQSQQELELQFLEAQRLGTELIAQQQLNAEQATQFSSKIEAQNTTLAVLNHQIALKDQQCVSLAQVNAENNLQLIAHSDQINQCEQALQSANLANNGSKEIIASLLVEVSRIHGEIEESFQRCKESEKILHEMDKSWERLFARYPHYYDFQSLEMIAQEQRDDQHYIQWQVQNLRIAPRFFRRLTFTTVINNGVAGFLIENSDSSSNSILNFRHESLLTVESELHDALEVASNFSAYQWRMMQTLCQLMLESLAGNGLQDQLVASDLLNAIDKNSLHHAICVLQKNIENLPMALRFDKVILKNEQVNLDYEHLWLQFKNFNVEGVEWPNFEFRFSCANLRPGEFGSHPKFEFPTIVGQAPFDKWFCESRDDFGEKMELRFAIPEAIDLDVWNALSDHDQTLLCAIAQRLPAIFNTLEANSVVLSRPWADWHALALNVQQIIETHHRRSENHRTAASRPAHATPNSPLRIETSSVPPQLEQIVISEPVWGTI